MFGIIILFAVWYNHSVCCLYNNNFFDVVILLTADNGWPGDSLIQKSVVSILKPAIKKQLPGSHHFHADPTSAPKVIDEVVAFLKSH